MVKSDALHLSEAERLNVHLLAVGAFSRHHVRSPKFSDEAVPHLTNMLDLLSN